MFRLWGKIIKNNKFIHDQVIEFTDSKQSKAEMIDESLNQLAIAFDIQKPMWFDKNTKELSDFSVTRFLPDQFIESVDFDFFEIEIIEQDP